MNIKQLLFLFLGWIASAPTTTAQIPLGYLGMLKLSAQPHKPAAHQKLSNSPLYEKYLRREIGFYAPIITALELQKALAAPNPPLLLDAREWDEYRVSHLPNARHIGFKTFDINALKAVDRNTPIVVYCTIGYRSDLVARYLLDHGFKRVQNFCGSILEWSNLGGALEETPEKPTTRVHTYDEKQARYLQRGQAVW